MSGTEVGNEPLVLGDQLREMALSGIELLGGLDNEWGQCQHRVGIVDIVSAIAESGTRTTMLSLQRKPLFDLRAEISWSVNVLDGTIFREIDF